MEREADADVAAGREPDGEGPTARAGVDFLAMDSLDPEIPDHPDDPDWGVRQRARAVKALRALIVRIRGRTGSRVVLSRVYARGRMSRERQPLVGRLLVGLFVVAVLALAVAFAWAIANGEAAVVTAATAILVFAAGEVFTRRRAANQYRWDKIADSYEAFIKLVRELGTPAGETRRLQQKTLKVLGEFNDKLVLWAITGSHRGVGRSASGAKRRRRAI